MRTIIPGQLAAACLVLATQTGFAAPTHPDFAGVWQLKFDFAALVKGNPDPHIDPPPYVATYQARYDAKLILVREGKLDLGGQCTPPGMPQISSSIGQFEILDAPKGRLTILYEYQSQIRRVYLDTQHPTNPDPTMNGDSVAHWEGNELIIDTIAIKDVAYLDANQGPHSEALHVIERMHLADSNNLQIDYTIQDAEALTRPWTYSKHFLRVPDGRLIDYYCNENPRNPVTDDGSLGFTFEHTP